MFPHADKIVHLFMGASVGTLCKGIVSPWVGLIVMAVPEVLQGFIPHRSFDKLDLLANLAGLLIGWYMSPHVPVFGSLPYGSKLVLLVAVYLVVLTLHFIKL